MVSIKVAFAIAIAAAGVGLVVGLCHIKSARLSGEKAKETHVAV
jgi:hypothetical protein